MNIYIYIFIILRSFVFLDLRKEKKNRKMEISFSKHLCKNKSSNYIKNSKHQNHNVNFPKSWFLQCLKLVARVGNV